ncbi:unnamed protein product [Penicillium olsonii]|uniref:Xylanolytic transcriptional activator regulatory domain-containing protein n=1 Tax=Penicillium olsonii TaxID=99116 RepID=A0A9W4MR98_PENOL|nr:unnamed protein product [Penicillium olsonii]
MSLVAGAFELHNSATPDTSMTTAMPGGQDVQGASEGPPKPGIPQQQHRPGRIYSANPLLQQSRSVTAELLSLLPSREVAALLVDTYFDRVHWFMLIFHQQDFRMKWQLMYDASVDSTPGRNLNPGPVSTFLMVIAIALQYSGSHRQQILQKHNVDPTAMKENILSVIRSKLLDIVASQSIEAVQTCVLLGTYYLYHGSPNLAWPVCGCGLRVAQALRLHRRLPITSPLSPESQQLIETRKRCWWAIYEIETFCSISYGYPHGIVDADCNVELLDPLATSQGQSPASYNEVHMCPATLLSYKYLMSKLSVFLKDALTELYGIGCHKASDQKDRSLSARFENLLQKVRRLDGRLERWKAEIPGPLCFDRFSRASYASVEEIDRDIGASGPKFETHVYQLQALALALAYDNAKILIHRPLMAYREKLSHNHTPAALPHPSNNSSHLALTACRNAAMSTSHVGESPIFSLAAETYAAAYISIHTFTAGVLLCVLSSIESLTPESQESKLGLRRILSMQAKLKSESPCTLSAQGLDILERLTRLVMEKELKDLLGQGSDASLQSRRTEPGVQENWEASQQGQLDAQLGQIMEPTHEQIMPETLEDTDVSQALFDLDQALFNSDSQMPIDPIFSDPNGPSNVFTQEQAWIWGMEDPVEFNQEW